MRLASWRAASKGWLLLPYAWCAWGFVAGASSGCATVVLSPTQEVRVRSEPAGAEVRIFDEVRRRDIALGMTPYSVRLPRGGGYFQSGRYRVTVTPEGATAKEFQISGAVSPWYVIGNLVGGGLIGWIVVDSTTGAMWELAPALLELRVASGARASDPASDQAPDLTPEATPAPR